MAIGEGHELAERRLTRTLVRQILGRATMSMIKAAILVALLSAAAPALGLAQTVEDLKNDERTPGDVLTYGMGYSQQRYSPLTHVNRDNVKRLVPAWSYSMADNRGQEAQPLVKDGVV